uniref:Calcium-activated potassium channel BK alpha subunit domain-containing protein n=1 Tax=Romanomermis culicivorax TaxID=13658 RepID=A0A915HPL4_ROMCU
VEQLALTFIERQKSGGEYSLRRAKAENHVVVVSTTLRYEAIYDFLNEFYAHPLLQVYSLLFEFYKLQDYFVLLLSPNELDDSMRTLLQVPVWTQRVIYMKGAALKDADLERVRLAEAEACFLLASRNEPDKNAADQHTILRSWAVRDYAPKCKQFVQIFRPENKMHVKHAEFVVCEDEFKYTLLACNCICPGISTLITLLLHTSRGQEGQRSNEPWHRLYGRHSGNEIYHVKLSRSKLFKEFIGKSFTYASFQAHRKYGVGLLGIGKDKVGLDIQLNPGPKRILRGTDTCYYMSITQEEQMTLTENAKKRKRRVDQVVSNEEGLSELLCACAHCPNVRADQYRWRNPAIILAADHASNGLYNFIIPLRAHYRNSHKLHPIILLLEEPPPLDFLDCLSYFPMIYWMLGNIESIDNLIRAGITLSQYVVVANKDNSRSRCQQDDYLADSGTMVCVQKMIRFFPQIRIITELLHTTNMRFMQFNAKDAYALYQSKIEKAYVKEYVIQFIRLLLGIDHTSKSGYLDRYEVDDGDQSIKTYGQLYEKVCFQDGDVPIGIYRTTRTDTSDFTTDDVNS